MELLYNVLVIVATLLIINVLEKIMVTAKVPRSWERAEKGFNIIEVINRSRIHLPNIGLAADAEMRKN